MLRLSFVVFALIMFSNLSGQERTWQDMMGDPNISFFEVQAAFNEAFRGIANEDIPKGAGYKPFKRWEYFMETRVDENGFYNPLQTQRAYEKYIKENPASREKGLTNPWTILGPSNQPTGNNGIGRINVIQVDPNNASTIYVGAPVGGIWKSTDDGTTWSTTTDFLPSIGVSDIDFDPSNSSTIYIVTGDRDHNDSSTDGIYKSTDAGATWNPTAFQPGNNGLPNFYLIHQLLIHPSNVNVQIASTTSGVFRTTDEWATWTEVLPGDCLRHMEFKPGDPNVIYGTTSTNYCGGLNGTATFFRSMNNGVSWSQTSLPGGGNLDRIGIGVTADNTSAVFLLGAVSSSGNDFDKLYRSTDSGASFTEINPSHEPSLGSQSWYDWSFTVDPNDEDVMYAGGVHIERTTNGGDTWTRVTNNGPNNVHVDHHYAKFYGSYLYVGSDGGIWRTDNGASSWDVLNDGLAITQYYRISNAESNIDRVLAGSQDNGTHHLTNGSGGNWIYEYGGDGMDNAIDPNDQSHLIASYQYGYFVRSFNTGASWSTMINPNSTGVNGAWVTPVKIDETNTNNIYVGYDRIWKSTNDGVNWTNPSGQALTPSNRRLRYIDVAPSNNNVIYTTDYFDIWRSGDGGTSWTALNDPGNSIRWIEIDETDENKIWIVSGNDVLQSTNGGSSWTDISANLPNIPMNSIALDYGSNEALYVGTDVGVYYKDAASPNWFLFNTDLPNVVVLEVDILESQDKVRVATFGRGVWEADLVSSNGGCSIDGMVDLGIATCDPTNNLYTRNIEVSYTNPPTTGSLNVQGQLFTITSSPQVVAVLQPANGAVVNCIAKFSDNSSCNLTINGLYTNPTVGTYYRDSDGDGFGNPSVSVSDCSAPTGFVADNTDCDDNDANNYPGNVEVCDGQDNDCDGMVDEGCSGNTCDGQFLVINNITQNTYRAEINITSDALVNNGQSILFTAGTDIDIVAPFEVVIGTEFEARIEPCIPQSINRPNHNEEEVMENLLIEFIQEVENNQTGNSDELMIFDISGEKLFSKVSLDDFVSNYKSVTENLEDGFYLIKAQLEGRVIEQKLFIINKK